MCVVNDHGDFFFFGIFRVDLSRIGKVDGADCVEGGVCGVDQSTLNETVQSSKAWEAKAWEAKAWEALDFPASRQHRSGFKS